MKVWMKSYSFDLIILFRKKLLCTFSIKFILIEIYLKVGIPVADIDFVFNFDTISLDYFHILL